MAQIYVKLRGLGQGLASELNNNAGPQLVAAIFQLERALYHLALGEEGDFVAVEKDDDVSVERGGEPVTQEQNKHSVKKGSTVLGDRTRDLWRTLQIWLEQIDERGTLCRRYLFVSNVEASGNVAKAFRDIAASAMKPADAVTVLRDAGKGRGKVQAIVNDVLSRSDAQLEALLGRIELVESADWSAERAAIFNGFAMDPAQDRSWIVSNLLGWITETLADAWRRNECGIVSRRACVKQVHALSRQLVRQRLLPRPSTDVTITESERQAAHSREFVARLAEISADTDVIYEAVEHFLQFGAERSRLAAEGDVPKREWGDRSERLRQRWNNVRRLAKLEFEGRSEASLGQLIFYRTANGHLERLGTEPCDEAYMTSGHYHRLADDDQVWWLPSYRGSGNAD